MNNLLSSVKKNVTKMNRNLANIQKNDMEKSSKAFNFISSKWSNRDAFLNVTSKGLQVRTDFKNMSRGELEHLNKISANYNRAKTATVRGVRSAYSKAYKSFVKKYKLDISYDDWKSIVEHQDFEDNKMKFGSETVIQIIKEHDVDTALTAMSESADINTINSFNRLANKIAKDN